jgi:hypothetical protein
MSSTYLPMRMILCSIALVLAAGCGKTEDAGPDAAPDALAMCDTTLPAMTYTQLYTSYFAKGTPGHCAEEDCHGEVSYNSWSCGSTKDKCFDGMANFNLIDTVNPLRSRLGSTRDSPLQWISRGGAMPADDIRQFPEGRDAILAWIAACARNN